MASTKWLRQIGHRALDLVFPPSCVVCHQSMDCLPAGIGICRHCQELFPQTTWATCLRCAARVPELPGNSETCPHCLEHKLRFDQTLSIGNYEGLLRDLILQMKDEPTGQIATALGKMLVEQFREQLAELQPDAIVPIPMHNWRKLSRPSNPVTRLAETVGSGLRVSVKPKLLKWQKSTTAQLGLSQPGRFRNIQGALAVSSGYTLDAPTLVVVDDVITTGATCSEAARVLKRAGAKRVVVLVLGRTPLG